MAKKSYDEVSKKIIEYVGGKDNITFFTHCITRLRFNVKDIDLINKEAIENLKEVAGTQWFGEQFQIIVGAKVDDIYATICTSYGFIKEEKMTEKIDQKKKIGINAVIEYVSGSVAPILPILIGTSFIKIVILIMETFKFGVGSGTYQILSFAGDAGFYFLPVFVGASAAKKLNSSVPLGMLMGAILIHPTLIEAVNNSTALDMFGAPVTLVNYSSGFLPVILSVYVMSKVIKVIRRFSPEFLQSISVPFLSIMIMLPISLCVLGPIGTVAGTYLGNALVWIYETLGFVGVAIMGAFSPLIIASGMHMTLVVYAITLFTEFGFEPLVFVTGIIVAVKKLAKAVDLMLISLDLAKTPKQAAP